MASGFPPRDIETARELCALAGRKTVITTSQSGNRWSYGETAEDVLDPHTVMGLPKGTVIIVAPGLVPDIILAQARSYWEYPEIAALTDENPYHNQRGGDDSDEAQENSSQDEPFDLAGKIERWRREE